MINKLCWCVHRVLCFLMLHAPERIYMFDDESDDFKPDGWFCAVCTKTWKEKGC